MGDTIPDAIEGEHLLDASVENPTDKKPVSVWKRLFLLTFVRCIWAPVLWCWKVWPLGLFIRTVFWSCKTSDIGKANKSLGLTPPEKNHIYEDMPEERVSRKRQAWAVWFLTAIYLLLYAGSVFLSMYFGNLLGGFVWPLIATQLVFGIAYTPFTMVLERYIPADCKPKTPPKLPRIDPDSGPE